MALSMWQWAEAATLILVVGRIAWVDIKTMRIPNSLTALLGAFGVIHQIVLGGEHILAASVTASLTGVALYAIRAMHTHLTGRIGLGLGDVKLSMAAALWLQPTQIPLFFIIASIFGLASSALFLMLDSVDIRNKRIPFGPSLGIALVLLWMSSVVTLFPLEYQLL